MSKQLILVMKLTAFILLIAFTQISAKGFSQTVTISRQNIPLGKVFRDIQRQTGYNFLCTKEQLAHSKKIDLNLKDAPLKKVLEYAFKDQPLTYSILNKTIIVKHKAPVLAQQVAPLPPPRQITGTVTDSSTGNPLAGVTIKVKGNTMGTVTDANGQFSLEVPEDAVLMVSYLGYRAKEIPVNGRTDFSISLTSATTGLNQLVVVGYGTQKKTSLTTAIASISGEELTNQSTSGDLRKTLQGMAPGLTILDQGGQPGNHAIQMHIRGVSSVNGSEPLVLVDGHVASLNDINPNAVESISILKDAASTAIYGSRGSNGIILITTKKGKEGPLKISYEGVYGLQNPTVLPEFLSTEEFLRFRNILAANEKMRNPNSKLPTYTEQEIQDYVAKSKEDPIKYPPGYYNLHDIFQTAPQTRHSLSISGGGKFIQTMLNMSYYYQDGLIWERNSERINLRMNNHFNLSKTLSGHMNLFYQASKQKTQASGFAEYEAVQGLNNPKKKFALGGGPFYDHEGNYLPKAAKKTNPRLEADTKYMGLKETTPHYYTIDGGLKWEPAKGLQFSGTYAFQYTDNKENYNIPKWDLGFKSYNNNALSYYNQHVSRTTFNLLANYNKSFNKHNISALAGYSTEEYRNEWQRMYSQDFFNNELRNISTGSQENIDISNGLGEWGLRSYFGRVTYNFDDKYYMELSLRLDGSSRFPKENRFSQFPGASIAWRVSQEKFWKELSSVISDFKIRYSYGQTGSHNGVGNYSYIPQLVLNQSYGFTTGPGGEYVVNTIIQNRLASQELSWEKVTQYDMGIDMGLLQNKLNITFDVFNKITNGILLDLPVPGVVGLNPDKVNAGQITNKGWELSTNWRSAINEFQYSVGFGIASVEDKLTDYGGLGITGIGGGYSRWEGSPLFAIRGYRTLGTYQTDAEAKGSARIDAWASEIGAGDYHYEDVNDDGVIDWDHDAQFLGDRTPKYTFNINLNLSWKGIDMSMLWNGVSDVQTIITGYLGEGGQWSNSPITAYWRNNYWSKKGDKNVHFSRPLFRQSNNTEDNSRDVNNGDYVRLKSLVLGYTLPSSITNKLTLDKVRIYINGTNLLTISQLTRNWGIDPEDAALGSSDSSPARHIYPLQLKTINFGISIQF